MTGFNRQFVEMLGRLIVFSTTYARLFPKGSVAAELLERIQTGFGKLSELAALQASGKGVVRQSATERGKARRELHAEMGAISRIARANGLKQFELPRERSDRAVLEGGKSFVANAQTLKGLFVSNHLPEDFIDRLSAAIQTLETALHEHTSSSAVRISTTGAIEQSRREAFGTVQKLDAIMENLLKSDTPTLNVWRSMRRIERAAPKPVQPESTVV